MPSGKNTALLAGIICVSIAAGIFIYQPLWGKISDFRPWRLGLDFAGGSYLEYEIDVSAVRPGDVESVLRGLRSVIEERINLFGVSEPRVYLRDVGGSHRLVVELAGIKNVDAAVDEIGDTPLLDFREVSGTNGDYKYIKTRLSGRHIKGAQVTFDSYTNKPVISFELTKEGAELFAGLTERNVGKPIAVFLDDKLVEQPVVREKITGGKAQITGNFTLEEARDIVSRFNAGALPAPISLVNRQTVSPTLGFSSLKKSIVAGAAALAAVVLYMLIFYKRLGLYAAGALIIYLTLLFGLFKLVPVTLSLATIAGTILSIGMAVDANVLVFERVKEEMGRGVPETEAIEKGFKRAWPSVRDANITTIISSAILFYITTSFVQGFALALLMGVLVSMFSAITVTRTMLKIRGAKFKAQN